MNSETRLAILRKTGDSDVLWLLDYANDLALSLDASRSREREAAARIAALEEALRDAAIEAHGHGLVRDHPDLFDVCPNYICRSARGEYRTNSTQDVKR